GKSRPSHPHLERIERSPRGRDMLRARVYLDSDVEGYLADHRVQGVVVFPGAGQLDLMMELARSTDEACTFIEDVEFRLPIVLGDAAQPTRLTLEAYSDEGHFVLAGGSDGDEPDSIVFYSRGRINHSGDRFDPPIIDWSRLANPCGREVRP